MGHQAAFLFDCARMYISQVLAHDSSAGGVSLQKEAGKDLIGRLKGVLSEAQLQVRELKL